MLAMINKWQIRNSWIESMQPINWQKQLIKFQRLDLVVLAVPSLDS